MIKLYIPTAGLFLTENLVLILNDTPVESDTDLLYAHVISELVKSELTSLRQYSN